MPNGTWPILPSLNGAVPTINCTVFPPVAFLVRRYDPSRINNRWPMGRGTLLSRMKNRIPSSARRSAREGGWSLIELTVTLFLLMAIALFGLKTMVAGFMLQNWSIAQSMTDAYAGIETAYAQRYVFSDIVNGGTSGVARWGVYPLAVTTTAVQIGQTPSLSDATATATAVTARHPDLSQIADPVTGAVSYLLESYVVYQNGQQKYCKVSKVYRDQ